MGLETECCRSLGRALWGFLILIIFELVVPQSWVLAIRSNCLWFVLGLRGSPIDCNSAMKYETEHDF